MSVTITFLGPLEHWTGRRSFETRGKTIREAFNALESQIGKSLINHMVNEETGELKSHFHVLLNGKDTELLNGLDEKLQPGDVITCVPPVGGG